MGERPMMIRSPICRLTALLTLLCPAAAWGLGTEELGNAPLSPANYTKWPGLVNVVNDPTRVYQFWVNGNENCYYTGSTDELNQTLASFAAAELEAHEVVLRPGPGTVKSFDGTKEFTIHWHLQIFGGIAGHLTTRDKGDQVWPVHPRLTIYTGSDIDLAKLKIPKEIKLVGLPELSKRARNGIASTDKTVRGWSAGVIAELDPYDKKNLAAVEKLLADEDDWVRLNAAGSIPRFGKPAATALPALKECLARPDKSLQERAQKAIDEIQEAADDAEKRKVYAEALAAIEKFLYAP
jgi:hypothetical protein